MAEILLPLARSVLVHDLGLQAGAWTALVLPGFVCGFFGIVAAFRGQRRRALWCGLLAAAPGLLFLGYVGYIALSDLNPWSMEQHVKVLWVGLVPAVLGFWAVLL